MPLDAHEQNRRSGNAATRQHHTHIVDPVERFERNDRLYPEDRALLGDLHGQRVVHLQCNDGQDTLSIARHLGGELTGVDISDCAIEPARPLASGVNLPAAFVPNDLFDWLAPQPPLYDVAYTSYGALFWLSSMHEWARGVSRILKPGGKLVVIEYHPLQNIFELDWTIGFPYMGGEGIDTGGVGDYVGNDYDGAFKNRETSVEFAYGIGDILGAILDAGLMLTHFREYPYMNGWKRFPNMIEREPGRFYLPESIPTLACMFSLTAIKPAPTTRD